MEGSIVQVAGGVLVSLVLAQQFDDDAHQDAVWVAVGWSLHESSHVQVGQLVVSHEHERWCIVWLVSVWQLSSGSSKTTEALAGGIDQLAVVNITSGSDNQVASSVVLGDEVLDLSQAQSGGILSNTERWLADLVISVRSVVNIFEGQLHHVSVLVDDVSVDDFSLSLELVLLEGCVVDDLAHGGNASLDIALEAGNVQRVSFSVNFLVQLASEGVHLLLDLSSGRAFASSESQVLQEVGQTTGLLSLMSRSVFPVESKTASTEATSRSEIRRFRRRRSRRSPEWWRSTQGCTEEHQGFLLLEVLQSRSVFLLRTGVFW